MIVKFNFFSTGNSCTIILIGWNSYTAINLQNSIVCFAKIQQSTAIFPMNPRKMCKTAHYYVVGMFWNCNSLPTHFRQALDIGKFSAFCIKGTVSRDFWVLVFSSNISFLDPLEVLWDDLDFYKKFAEIYEFDISSAVVSFLKNCSFKSCGSLHFFINDLPSVSYTTEFVFRSVRYTAESPFRCVSYTGEFLKKVYQCDSAVHRGVTIRWCKIHRRVAIPRCTYLTLQSRDSAV